MYKKIPKLRVAFRFLFFNLRDSLELDRFLKL